nr:hypothetical protein [uncultured Megasphaera sp.]
MRVLLPFVAEGPDVNRIPQDPMDAGPGERPADGRPVAFCVQLTDDTDFVQALEIPFIDFLYRRDVLRRQNQAVITVQLVS